MKMNLKLLFNFYELLHSHWITSSHNRKFRKELLSNDDLVMIDDEF